LLEGESQVRKGIFLLLGAACVAALSAGGCGGGDESTTITTSSISKDQFIRKANAICLKGRQQVETAASTFLAENPDALESKNEPDFSELTQTIFVPAIEQETEEIRALGAPQGDQGEVEAILTAVEEGREKSEEDPKAAALGGSKAFKKADALAAKYGLDSCATR
jgi:hypothetical protein